MRNAEYALSRGLFLRALGLVYASAFLSLAVQAQGLFGARGILPASSFLALARRALGEAAPLELPTLFWVASSDAFLLGSCGAGVALGVALAAGLAPRATTAGLWALYLSWVHVGQVFLAFQWDALLLEAGLLAVWLAPRGWRVPLAATPPPPAAPLFLLHWLVFRLFLLSGLVKLLSGDPAWRDLSAMSFHYWTQPLPNLLSPFVHAAPLWLHRIETIGTFSAELVMPWLVFGPPLLRRVAAAGIVALMLVINATGNYGFFGPLACVLAIPLVDDAVWRRLPGLRSLPAPPAAKPSARWRRAVAALAVATVLAITTGAALRRLVRGVELPAPWRALLALANPLDSFHAYGLFAVMTKDRPEIEIEGSRDGEQWLAYQFRYKPDRSDEPPPLLPLHMPRLDWQLWFAALDECASTPWIVSFQRRLLEAEPSVLALLARDPFAGERPRFVRATRFRYRFADAETRRRTGDWWVRERLGPYCPVLELAGDELRAVRW